MTSKEPTIPGYMIIRQFVIDIIAKSGNTPKKIPSNRELAKKFGVSHPTVLRAIKDLIADGYLMTQKGIGTFTCGKLGTSNNVKMVGMLVGDGKQIFNGKLGWNLIAEAGKNLLDRSDIYRLKNLYLACSSDNLFEAIQEQRCDGIIWITPQENLHPQIIRLKTEANLPLVCIGTKVKGVSSAGWDFGNERYEMTCKLLADGKHQILTVVCPDSAMQDRIDNIKRAYNDYNIPFNENMIIIEGKDTHKRLEDLIDFGFAPDAIALTGDISPYYDMLKSKLDGSQCTLISGELTTYKDMDFSGLLVKRNLAPAIEAIITNLLEQVHNPDKASVVDLNIELEMVYQ